MRIKILLLFYLLLLLTYCSTTNKLDVSKLPGIYSWDAFEKSETDIILCFRQIKLFEDSTFTYFVLEGKQSIKISGIWHFNNNTIILRSEPNPSNVIKSADDSLYYFDDKALYFYQNRLYDREIKKGKGIRKNYYEKLERDHTPAGNSVFTTGLLKTLQE